MLKLLVIATNIAKRLSITRNTKTSGTNKAIQSDTLGEWLKVILVIKSDL